MRHALISISSSPAHMQILYAYCILLHRNFCHQCLDFTVYRRHCNQNCLPEKSLMDLRKFQSQVAHSLLLSGKERSTGTRRRGRPSQDNA